MDIGSFRLRYPEFDAVLDSYVSAALAESDSELASIDDWGTRRDTAQGLLTAHKLWASPFGSTMRLDGDGKEMESRYFQQYEALLTKTFPAFLVT